MKILIRRRDDNQRRYVSGSEIYAGSRKGPRFTGNVNTEMGNDLDAYETEAQTTARQYLEKYKSILWAHFKDADDHNDRFALLVSDPNNDIVKAFTLGDVKGNLYLSLPEGDRCDLQDYSKYGNVDHLMYKPTGIFLDEVYELNKTDVLDWDAGTLTPTDLNRLKEKLQAKGINAATYINAATRINALTDFIVDAVYSCFRRDDLIYL